MGEDIIDIPFVPDDFVQISGPPLAVPQPPPILAAPPDTSQLTQPAIDTDMAARMKTRADLLRQLHELNSGGALSQTEPKSSFEKARYSMANQAIGGIADALVGAGKAFDLLEPDAHIPGSKPLAVGERVATALAKPFREIGDASEVVANATPGNELAAAIAGGLGSMVPTALAAVVPVPGSGLAAAGLQQYGQTFRQAKDYLLKLGVPENEAERVANQVGLVSGTVTGVVTHYTPHVLQKIPILGKYLGDEGLEAWTNRFLAEDLKKAPSLVEVAKRVAGAMGSESIEEGVDQAFQAAIAKKTFQPDMTWKDALQQVGLAALAGGISAGVFKGPMELARFAGKVEQKEAAKHAEWESALTDIKKGLDMQRADEASYFAAQSKSGDESASPQNSKPSSSPASAATAGPPTTPVAQPAPAPVPVATQPPQVTAPQPQPHSPPGPRGGLNVIDLAKKAREEKAKADAANAGAELTPSPIQPPPPPPPALEPKAAEAAPIARPEDFILPKELSKSSPRYSEFPLEFASDLDKAAYILARDSQGKSSAAAPKFSAALQEAGFDKAEVVKHGLKIIAALKPLYRDAVENRESVIRLPKFEFGSSPEVTQPVSTPVSEPTPESPKPVEPPPVKAWGADNKIVTPEQMDVIRKRLREKLQQMNAGIDPEFLSLGTQMAVFHVEAGARKFADFSKRMTDELGEKVKPYLQSWYLAARNWPGIEKTGMETEAEIEASFRKPVEQPTPAPATAKPSIPEASSKLATWIRDSLESNQPVSWQALFERANREFGGTQADGTYSVKDAYDAMEMGVVRYIADHPERFGRPENAAKTVLELKRLTDLLPTQTKRTAEQDEFQQFSTPPPLAFMAAWVANIRPGESVLEPSAGTGGLAVFAKAFGAGKVWTNELSPRRRALLEQSGLFTKVFGENAEHLNSVLPADISPNVVIMNPPFSATAGRMQGVRRTSVGAEHLDQALKRLAPGGRLVAIVGEGMAMDRPAFSKWWAKTKSKYEVRANVGISGDEYRKYGTTFGNQLVVIDKTGNPTSSPVVTGKVDKIEDLVNLLNGVRDVKPVSSENANEEAKPVGPRSGEVAGESGATAGKPGPASDVPANGVGSEPAGGEPSGGSGQDKPGTSDRVPVSRPEPRGDGELPGMFDTGERGAHRPPAGADRVPEPGGSSGVSAGELRSGDIRSDAGAGGLESEAGKTSAGQAESRDRGKIEENAVFEDYSPQATIPGARAHPTALAESAAMASVDYPVPKVSINIPKRALDSGAISAPQLENVLLAAQAHERILPDGQRQGYFVGDGTGVGKGRTNVGIFWDNWNKGRRRHLWMSKNMELGKVAQGDFLDMGFKDAPVVLQNKFALGEKIDLKEGVLFSTYDTVASEGKKKGPDGTVPTRLGQIKDWLGPDFDGVIVFDESHEMRNALDSKGDSGRKKDASKKALAAVEMQKLFPKARIVYVSATGATEVENLGYAQRLGLWGEGTPFPNVRDFISKIGSGGVAAMEAIARDLKSFGLYLSRSLNFKGVTQREVEQRLTPEQVHLYNTLAEAWQVVLQDIDAALGLTSPGDASPGKKAKGSSEQRKNATSAFWGAHQRFFNAVITSLQMPAVIESVRADIARGESVVLQLVNTNEAPQERAISKASEQGSGGDLDAADMTPRDILIQFIEASFPTAQTEVRVGEDGSKVVEIVKDSNGNIVHNAEALAMRDALMNKLASIPVPEGALQILLNEFGTDQVAEVTGRKRRIVEVDGQRQIQKRGKKANDADVTDFKNDKKRILVFSDAGGTGQSYHADVRYVNQRRRNHYILQPGWRADSAVQGLGRSHRSNQAVPPEFVVVSTDIPGHKRFVSTIARRIEQLGALTKGQRQTTSQGVFDARDNLESSYAKEALKAYLRDIGQNRAPGGIDAATFEKETGITLVNDRGEYVGDKVQITNFLNRLLSMTIEKQHAVFDGFSQKLDSVIDFHKANGTLDVGLETLTSLGAKVAEKKEIWEDKNSGAKTNYLKVELVKPSRKVEFEDNWLKDFSFVRNKRSGQIWMLSPVRSRTGANGVTENYFMARSPQDTRQSIEAREVTNEKFDRIPKENVSREWSDAVAKIPPTYKETVHMIEGAVVRIWDKLPSVRRIARVQLDDGSRVLGVVLSPSEIPKVLQNFGITDHGKVEFSLNEIESALDRGSIARLANGWRLAKKTVSGEERTELIGPDYAHHRELEKNGVILERIGFKMRYFIPTGEKAESVLSSITASRPVVEILNPNGNQSLIPIRERPSNTLGTDRATQVASDFAKENPSAPSVRFIDNPEMQEGGGRVQAYYDEANKQIVVNRPAVKGEADLKAILREEWAHSLLSSPEGAAQVNVFAKSRMTPRDRQRLSELYHQRLRESDANYENRLANEFIAKAWRDKLPWWKELIERAQSWLASKGIGNLSNEQVAREILRSLRRVKNLEIPARRVQPSAFSLAPLESSEDFKRAASSSAEMDPEDAKWNAVAGHAEFALSAGMVRDSYEALPPEVKQYLPMISQRLAGEKVSRTALGRTFGMPQGDLRTVAEKLSESNPHRFTDVVFRAAVNILSLVDSANSFLKDVAREHSEFALFERNERAKSARERVEEAANTILGVRRGQLLQARDQARAINNPVSEARAKSSLATIEGAASGMSNVIDAVVKMTSNPSDRAQLLEAAGKLTPDIAHANDDLINAFRSVATSDPEKVGKLLQVIKDGKDSIALAEARERLALRDQAAKFVQESLLGNPRFKQNYEQAVSLVGAEAIFQKRGAEGEPVFSNPAAPHETVTLSNGFGEKDFSENVEKMLKAADWCRSYLESENPDPLKAAGARKQLDAIETVHFNQLFNPKEGKLVGEGLQHFLIRFAGGLLDVPEYALDMAGGRAAYETYQELQNYSNVRNAVPQANAKYRVEAVLKAVVAAKDHDMSPIEWKRKVGDPILGSYQNPGDVRIRRGMKLRGGIEVTAKDMEAVMASKRYMDGLMGALREMQSKTETGRRSEIKIRDRIGDTLFQREAQDPTGMTVPQRISVAALAFVDAWAKAKTEVEQEELLNSQPFFETEALSHVESFSDPAYAKQFKDSPLIQAYKALAAEWREGSFVVPTTFDELVKAVTAKQSVAGDKAPLTKDAVKKTLLGEVNKFVELFTKDEQEAPKPDDAADIEVLRADNFLNRPRGRRILPKGNYEYTAVTTEDHNSVQNAALEVYAQRYINRLDALLKALRKQQAEFSTRTEYDPEAKGQILEEQKAGKNFLNADEVSDLIPMIERSLSNFRKHVKARQETEADLYSGFQIARGVLSNSLLQNVGTLVSNYAGPVVQRVFLDMVLNDGSRLMARIPLVRPLAVASKAVYDVGLSMVGTAIRVLSGGQWKSPRFQRVVQDLKANQTFYAKLMGYAFTKLQLDALQMEKSQRLGVVDRDPWLESVRMASQLFSEGGQITKRQRSRIRKLTDSSVTLLNETGGGFQLPRALASNMVDRRVNEMAVDLTSSAVDKYRETAARISKALSQLNPLTDTLTPEIALGYKASKTDLAQVRQFFGKAGVNFDRTMIEYAKALGSAKEQGGNLKDVPFLSEAQRNSLELEVAKFTNKGLFSNRPFYTSQGMAMAGLFLGYNIGQNSQMARARARSSLEKSKFSLRGLDMALGTAVGVMAAGSAFYLYDYLRKLLYKEDSQVKPLSQAKSAKDVATSVYQMSGRSIPMVGNLLANVAGSVLPGGKFGQGGAFNLLVGSFFSDILQTASKISQTHESARPIMEFIRRYIPNSRIIINRLDMRDGMTNEAMMRAALVANAPDGMDVKIGSRPTGVIKYSPASGNVDNVVNALSRTGGTAWETVESERAEGIQRLMKESNLDEQTATDRFDKAVLARNPYTAVYGREPTQQERDEILSKLTPEQRQVFDTVEAGRQNYASRFGHSAPDFIKTERGPGAAASGILGGGSTVAAAHRGSAGGGGVGLGSAVAGVVPRGGGGSASFSPVGGSANAGYAPVAGGGAGVGGGGRMRLRGGGAARVVGLRRLRAVGGGGARRIASGLRRGGGRAIGLRGLRGMRSGKAVGLRRLRA